MSRSLAGWRRPSPPSVVAAACLASVALGALLVASGRGLAIPMGGLLLGLGEGEFRVVFLTLRAEATPDALMGPVSSAGRLVVYGAGGIGVAWVSLFLQWLGGPAAFGLLAVLALALAGWVLAARPLAAPGRIGDAHLGYHAPTECDNESG